MIGSRSEVTVQGIACDEFLDFMMNCTDSDYQQWWPGTHLAFHTIKRYDDKIGNVVYFDEYVGKYRLKFKGIVTKFIPQQTITWQMKMGIKLPAWLNIDCQKHAEGLYITHTVMAGFKGIGRIFDPLFKIYFSENFCHELDRHAQTEFPMLGELLVSRRKASNA